MHNQSHDSYDALRYAQMQRDALWKNPYVVPLQPWNPYGDICIAGKPIAEATINELKFARNMLDKKCSWVAMSDADRNRLLNAINYYIDRGSKMMNKSNLREAYQYLSSIIGEITNRFQDRCCTFNVLRAAEFFIGEYAIIKSFVDNERTRSETENVRKQLGWIVDNLGGTKIGVFAAEYFLIVKGVPLEERSGFQKLIAEEEELVKSIEEVRSDWNRSPSKITKRHLDEVMRLMRVELEEVRKKISIKRRHAC